MLLDSLQKVYQTAKHDTTRILALTSIAYEYRNNKPDTCIAIAEQALAQSEKTGFEKGKAWARLRIARAKITKGDFEIATTLLEKAQQGFEKIEDVKGLAWNYQAAGFMYEMQSKFALAVTQYEKAIKYYEIIGDEQGIAGILMNTGTIYRKQGNYPQALNCYTQSLELAEKMRDKQLTYRILGNTGILYSDQNNFPKALDYYQRSMALSKEMADEYSTAVALNVIGVLYAKQGKLLEALEYYQKSLAIRERFADKNEIAISLNNIADVYMRQDNSSKALAYYQRSLAIHTAMGDKRSMTYPLIGMAQIYRNRKDYDKSIDYAKKSLEIAQEINVTLEIKNASETLYKTYKLKGDDTKALEYHELYKQMNDSIFNVENTEKITNLENKAETAEKEKEIALLNKNQEILKKDSKFQLTIIYVIAAFSIAGMAVSYFLFLSRKRNIRAKNVARELSQKIELQRQSLSEQAEELNTTLHTVEKQRDNIISSINYALRIQNAIIPKEQEIQKHFPESFVLFRPKDIVSGDFYWFADKMTAQGNKKIMVVADCTGHGVSGAFMTMIGNNMLNHIVHDQEVTEPNEILNLMTPLLKKTLLHSDGTVKDGMDISVVAIQYLPEEENITKIETTYAGAMNPLYYIENQEFKEIKADKVPIGGGDRQREGFTYQKHEINNDKLLMTDDNANKVISNSKLVIYLCTDGFQDQFGGKENRKFMVSKFKKLLLEISEKPMAAQKQILETTITDWILAGNETQTDDICVVGIRI